MPKPTFFNLPPEKARRIEEAALVEFTEHAFKAASINRIVARADIAKGSFYQYFHDKKDLYKHTINQIVAQKLASFSSVLNDSGSTDFFSQLRMLYQAGLRFTRENPRLQKIGDQLLRDRNSPVYEELVQENLHHSDQIMQEMIRKGIDQGDLRPGLDIQLYAWLISRMNVLLSDYYLENVHPASEEVFMETVDKMIHFIAAGISQKEEMT